MAADEERPLPVPRYGLENTLMAAERSVRPRAGKRGAKRDTAPIPEQTPPRPERQFVDIDPWAVLLEQLMEVPEEGPAERKGGKGK